MRALQLSSVSGLVLLIAPAGILAQHAIVFSGLMPSGLSINATALSSDGTTLVGWIGANVEAMRWRPPLPPEGLGFLPGPSHATSEAWGTSGDGCVVTGMSESWIGLEAFRWEGGTMAGLGVVPGGKPITYGYDVSDNGVMIVGLASVPSGMGAIPGAFLWASHTMTVLQSDKSGDWAVAYGISADGIVVVGQNVHPAFPYNIEQGCRWDDGILTLLGDIPGGFSPRSRARAVSGNGAIAVGYGYYGNFASEHEAVVWRRKAKPFGLGDLPGSSATRSSASAASFDGRVVVGTGRGPHGADAFVWDPVHGMRELAAVLEAHKVDLKGYWLKEVRGISDDGTVIAGTAINPAGKSEAFRAVIPPFCYPDCDGSGTLDVFDILCFVNRFWEHEGVAGFYSDCDQDGKHDGFDFLCFLNAFNAGCE